MPPRTVHVSSTSCCPCHGHKLLQPAGRGPQASLPAWPALGVSVSLTLSIHLSSYHVSVFVNQKRDLGPQATPAGPPLTPVSAESWAQSGSGHWG